MKITLLVVLLCLMTYNAYSQTLIDKSKKDIQSEMIKRHGVFRGERTLIDPSISKSCHTLLYTFNENDIKKTGLFLITFYLIDNQCYRSIASYTSRVFQKEIVGKLDLAQSNYKRQSGNYVWFNSKNKVYVQILDVNSNGVQSDKFVLEAYKKNEF